MKRILLYLCFILFHFQAFGQAVVKVSVEADNPLYSIQPGMWGLFFEDINFAADGGLYAELVKNRSFEFPDPLEGWSVEGAGFFNSPLTIVNSSDARSRNPRMARIRVDGSVCMVNSGFRGIGIKENESYRFTMLSSLVRGDIDVRVTLLGEDGREAGFGSVHPRGTDVQEYESVLVSDRTDARGGLRLCFEGEGIVDIDMVSLFPVNTWKERSKGLREDLVQMLADLDPYSLTILKVQLD